MRTPRSVILWQHRLSATARVITVLACLLLAVPAGSAQPLPQQNPSLVEASSLGQFPSRNRPLGLLSDGVVSPGPSNYRLPATSDKTRHSAIAYPEANPGDENWASGLFALPGTDYTVSAMGVGTNGHVYVGGDFMLAGTIVANHIARWDGTTWSPLGSGVSGEFSVHIDALAVDAAGNLYVGGEFVSAGGVSVNNIAKWDGVSWSALGGGVNGRVRAMAVDSAGNLYAGGEFTEAGGVSARYIAKWNGVAWSPLGSGMAGTSQPWVLALAIDGAGNLYASGNFIIAGGIEVAYIAKWNGSSWSQLGSGIWGCNSSCGLSLVVDASGDLYVGGGFTVAGGITANRIAKWDGTSWSALGSGIGGAEFAAVFAMTVDRAGNLYAGGKFAVAGGISANNIARWNGVSWSAVDGGISGDYSIVEALTIDSADNLYAGGSFTTAGTGGVRHIARWDGTAWSATGSGISGEMPGVSALAVNASNDIYAGGYFTATGEMNANSIARWDGEAWSSLASGITGCGQYRCVTALVVDDDGDLYAGGDFTNAGGVTTNNIARWDGITWSPLSTGTDSWVGALVLDRAGNLYVGGDFTTAGEVSVNHVAKWDGTSWSPLGSGTNGKVEALAFDTHGNLYAAGEFTTAGGINAHSIAKWDGSTWSPLGSGADPSVGVLAVDADDNVYAGGYLHVAGGINVSYIAKWDGVTWSDLNGGLGGLVDALAIDRAGNLYAGGFFGGDRKVSTHYIARWDGSAWFPLGSGMGGFVHALTLDRIGNLYAGGGFTTAGNHVSAYVARWTAADGVRGVTTGSYTLYANNLPVTIDVVTPGTLDRLAVQRFNRSHTQATPYLATGYYWDILGTDASGNPATGYVVDLTLPTTFTPGADDRVCRYTGSAWDCAASAYTASSITRTGITQLSDWAVQDNVTCADFDGDGTIDIDDLIAIATRWGQTSGMPGWDGRFDLRPDGHIDVVDIQLAAAQWGQSCSFQVHKEKEP